MCQLWPNQNTSFYNVERKICPNTIKCMPYGLYHEIAWQWSALCLSFFFFLVILITLFWAKCLWHLLLIALGLSFVMPNIDVFSLLFSETWKLVIVTFGFPNRSRQLTLAHKKEIIKIFINSDVSFLSHSHFYGLIFCY